MESKTKANNLSFNLNYPFDLLRLALIETFLLKTLMSIMNSFVHFNTPLKRNGFVIRYELFRNTLRIGPFVLQIAVGLQGSAFAVCGAVNTEEFPTLTTARTFYFI